MSKRQTLFGDLSGLDLDHAETINIDFIPAGQETFQAVDEMPKEIPETSDTKITQLHVNDPAPIQVPDTFKDQIMSVYDVAAYLHVRQETILRKIYSKEIKASKIGRIWRLKLSDINAYLERNSDGFKEE